MNFKYLKMTETIREVVFGKTDGHIRSWIVVYEHKSYYIKRTYKNKYIDGSYHITTEDLNIYNEDEFLALVNVVLSVHTPHSTTKKNELAIKILDLLQKHLK